MSHLIMLGNALRRDRFWLSLPVAETILRALAVYPLTLIDRGRIRQDGLAKELLTESELLITGRRQVSSSLEEIESCVWDGLQPKSTGLRRVVARTLVCAARGYDAGAG
jgi:hypothetical protein